MFLKKIICFMIAVASTFALAGVTLTLNASATPGGKMHEQVVFPSDRVNNYRIPSVVSSKSGATFVFCEDRLNTLDDYAQFKKITFAVAKDGKNFSKHRYMVEKDGWSFTMGSAVYDELTDTVMLIFSSRIVTNDAQLEYSKTPANERFPLGFCVAKSSDLGETWTFETVDLPKVTVDGETFTAGLHGSSSGIQIQKGKYKGRLVMAAKLPRADSPDISIMSHKNMSLLIYSDDSGKTWKAGNSMPVGTDESTVCELSDGSLMINCRTAYGDHSRYVGISYDGGVTFKKTYRDRILVQTAGIGVRAGLVSFPNPKQPGKNVTLYSCPNSYNIRLNMCIWISYDDGATWTDMIRVYPGRAAYSDMKYNSEQQCVTMLYEFGTSSAYSGGIKAMTFDFDWIEANKEELPEKYRDAAISQNLKPEMVKDGLSIHVSPETFSGLTGKIDRIEDRNGTVLESAGSCDIVVKDDVRNGHPALYFPKEGNSFFKTDVPSNIRQGKITCFIVFRRNGDNADLSDQILLSSAKSGITVNLQKATNRFAITFRRNDTVNILSDSLIDKSWHIMAIKWDTSGDCPFLSQYLDGSSEQCVSYRSGKIVSGKAENLYFGDLQIGRGLNGYISEIAVFDRAFSEDEIASTGLYLAKKYNLSWKGIPAGDDNEPDTPETTFTETEAQIPEEKKKGCGAAVLNSAVPMSLVLTAAALKKKGKHCTGKVKDGSQKN